MFVAYVPAYALPQGTAVGSQIAELVDSNPTVPWLCQWGSETQAGHSPWVPTERACCSSLQPQGTAKATVVAGVSVCDKQCVWQQHCREQQH
jgi:hypothetical protein